MARFLSKVDMAAAKHHEAVFNARIKRGEIPNADTIRSTRHVVCGCGEEGCMCLSA